MPHLPETDGNHNQLMLKKALMSQARLKNANANPQDPQQLDLWGQQTAETGIAEEKTAFQQQPEAHQPVGQISIPLDEPVVFPDEAERIEERLQALTHSKFRMSWNLKLQQIHYIQEKGIETVARHADGLIASRLAPAFIPNDGSQTPMKGHPVFIAQHATGTCCRSCLMKWHQIRPGSAFTPAQQHYVTSLIMTWMHRQLGRWANRRIPPPPKRPQKKTGNVTQKRTFNQPDDDSMNLF